MLACELISKVLSSTCSEPRRRKHDAAERENNVMKERTQGEDCDVTQTDSDFKNRGPKNNQKTTLTYEIIQRVCWISMMEPSIITARMWEAKTL